MYVGTVARMRPAMRLTLVMAVMMILSVVGSATAIIGGYIVPAAQLRYTARIMITNGTGHTECTGTVVRPYVILTAAHCVVDPATGRQLPTQDYVVLTSGPNVTLGPTYPHSVRAITHSPGYVVATRRDDMALLQLATPSTAHVVPVATPADAAWAYRAGHAMLVAGFGQLSQWPPYAPSLNAVALSVLSDSACATQDVRGYPYVASAMFCGAVPSSTQAICYGDSGGPVLETSPSGVVTEVGTTSFVSTLTGACPPPSYFVRLTAFAPWLTAQIVHLQLTSDCPSLKALSRSELARIAQYRHELRGHVTAATRRQITTQLTRALAQQKRYVASERSHACI